MELYRLEEAKTCLDWIIPAVFSGKDGRIRRDCPVEVRLFTAEDLQCEKEAEHTADVLGQGYAGTLGLHQASRAGVRRTAEKPDGVCLSLGSGRTDETEVYGV